MSRYSDQVRDEYGRTVPGVSIYVYKWDADADAAGDLETLTDDLSAPLANPLTSDADGLFYFNSVDGQKLIEYHFGGKVEFRDLILVGALPVPQAVFGGLLVNANALTIPTGMDAIGTTGADTLDHGGANYVAGTAPTARSGFTSANARAFVLSKEQVITPQMFYQAADTDFQAAYTDALSYLSTGGELTHSDTSYTLATALSLASKHNISLTGPSGGGAGGGSPPPSQITFSGTGTAGGINAAHAEAVVIRDMAVRYSDAFTGDLIAFTNLTAGSDAAYSGLDRVLAGGIGSHNGARSVVSFEGAIISAVTNSHLQKAQVGIRFCKQVGVGNVLYSNANISFNNTFDNLTTAALTDMGQGCLSLADRAEGTNDGTSGGMPAFYLDTLDVGASPGNGNSFIAPWCGDDVALTTAWWCNGNRQHQGLLFAGGFYGTSNTSKPCLKFSATVQGAAVVGTYMAPVSIDLASVDHYALFFSGNYFGADVTNLTASSDDIFIVANKLNGGFAKNYVRLHTIQEWRIGARATNVSGGLGIFAYQAPASMDLAFWLNADAGKNRLLTFASDGTPVAKLGLDTSNNYVLQTFTALGALVGSAITVTPTTMALAFGGAISAPSVAVGGGTALTKIVAYAPTLTPASVAAATVAEQTFTVTGLTTADKVIVNPPAIANATGIAGARVSAADTLAIRFVNPTAGALTPTSGTYTVMAFRS